MDPVRKLILERLAELGLQRKEVSEQMGCNITYLSQFLKRGVPAELKEIERVRLAAILKVHESMLRGPSTKVLVTLPVDRVAEKRLDVDSPRSYARVDNAPHITPASDLFGNADLPVYGTAQGEPGAGAIVTQQAVDWSIRPPSLMRVREGYGLIVPDDTMSPEHRAGSIALVNPHLPPKVEESCVLRCVADDGTHRALIRIYRGETDTHWKVGQYNPPRSAMLKKSAWTCQKAVGNYFA